MSDDYQASESSFLTGYRRDALKKISFITVCLALLVAVIGYTCTITRGLTALESYGYIYRHIIGYT